MKIIQVQIDALLASKLSLLVYFTED
jgi:hypothetical protein